MLNTCCPGRLQASGPEVFGKLTPAHNSLAKALSTLSKFKGKPGELVLVPEQGKVADLSPG
jgi:hypothetical protein